jgi:hypothetical protein
MDISTSFTLIILYDEAFAMAMVRNFEVMLTQTLNHCVQFRNFVYCHSFVNYLISTLSD